MNSQALDQAKVAELEELQEGLFERVVLLFLQESPADIARMREAIDAGDAGAVRAAAHKIKGSAAAVGAVSVSTVAFQLEQIATQGDLSSAGDGLVTLDESLQELGTALGRAGLAPPAP